MDPASQQMFAEIVQFMQMFAKANPPKDGRKATAEAMPLAPTPQMCPTRRVRRFDRSPETKQTQSNVSGQATAPNCPQQKHQPTDGSVEVQATEAAAVVAAAGTAATATVEGAAPSHAAALKQHQRLGR